MKVRKIKKIIAKDKFEFVFVEGEAFGHCHQTDIFMDVKDSLCCFSNDNNCYLMKCPCIYKNKFGYFKLK